MIVHKRRGRRERKKGRKIWKPVYKVEAFHEKMLRLVRCTLCVYLHKLLNKYVLYSTEESRLGFRCSTRTELCKERTGGPRRTSPGLRKSNQEFGSIRQLSPEY